MQAITTMHVPWPYCNADRDFAPMDLLDHLIDGACFELWWAEENRTTDYCGIIRGESTPKAGEAPLDTLGGMTGHHAEALEVLYESLDEEFSLLSFVTGFGHLCDAIATVATHPAPLRWEDRPDPRDDDVPF